MTEKPPGAKPKTLDAAELAKVDAIFDAHAEKWRAIGDTGMQARLALLEASAPGNPVRQRATGRYIRELRYSLAGPEASPLERVLADRAALALVDADRLDRLGSAIETQAGYAANGLELLDRRRSRAHARALAAVRSLAIVRRLLGPRSPTVAVQVNVANAKGE